MWLQYMEIVVAAHSLMYGKRGGRTAAGLVAKTVIGALAFAVFFPDKLSEVTKVCVTPSA